MTKRALITGITGQDGSYLSELLLKKGYEVHGIVRRSSSFNTERIDHLYQDPHDKEQRLILHFGDMGDSSSINSIVASVLPDEIYNLAAQSHVRVSFDIPEYTADVTALGTIRLLEAIRKHKPDCRFYQASSSELFGNMPPPQNENTSFDPRSPYAAAKAYAYHVTKGYRSYGMFTANGILFNHESERRGETFVTRKISRAVGRIWLGLQDKLFLGSLSTSRDWGHAEDYVYAMWLMLQHKEPDDFVIGTGKSYSVADFLQIAFGHVGLVWQDFVACDTRYSRPQEVDFLQADASKAKRVLEWAPRVQFNELVVRMVESDVELAAREKRARG